jgi:hypothetical protein
VGWERFIGFFVQWAAFWAGVSEEWGGRMWLFFSLEIALFSLPEIFAVLIRLGTSMSA